MNLVLNKIEEFNKEAKIKILFKAYKKSVGIKRYFIYLKLKSLGAKVDYDY